MFSYAYRLRYLQKLHSEAFMGLNAVVLPDTLPAGAVYRSSLPATPVSTPIRESWLFSEQALRDRLCKTPSPRKCRFFDPRHSEAGLNSGSFEAEWLESTRKKMIDQQPSVDDEDSNSKSSPEDNDSVKENVNFHQKKLFIGNISYRVTRKQLREFFSKFGKVIDVIIIQDHLKHRPKGYGFVTFSKVEEARKARNAPAEELVVDGRELRLMPAEERRTTKLKREAQSAMANNLKDELDGDDEEDEEEEEEYCGPPTPQNSVDDRAIPTPPEYVGHINDLPDEMLLAIFSFLDLKSKVRSELVCRKWRQLLLKHWQSQDTIDFANVFSFFVGGPLDNTILKKLLLRAPNIKKLDFSNAVHDLSYEAVEIICQLCPNLEYIDLTGVKVTNVSVQQLAQKCQKLRTVILKKVVDVGEKGIWWLLHLCKRIEHIDLTENYKLTGQCFHMAGSNLTCAVLKNCPSLTSVGLAKLATRCQNLTKLYLDKCKKMTDADLDKLCTSLKNLKVFHLSDLLSPGVSTSGLFHIAKLINLEELNLSYSKEVNDDLVQAICRNCNKLRWLDISGCHTGITDCALTALSKCPRLRSLYISYLDKITDVGIRSLACQGQIETLQSRGCSNLTDEGFKMLVELSPNLHSLDLSGCYRVTNETIEACHYVLSEGGRTQTLTIRIGGTDMDTEKLKFQPHERLKVLPQSLCKENLRPDRADYIGARHYESEEEEEAGDPEWAATQRFVEDYCSNDDPLLEEEFELS